MGRLWPRNAAENSSIEDPALKPWHLKRSFQLLDKKGSERYGGSVGLGGSANVGLEAIAVEWRAMFGRNDDHGNYNLGHAWSVLHAIGAKSNIKGECGGFFTTLRSGRDDVSCRVTEREADPSTFGEGMTRL